MPCGGVGWINNRWPIDPCGTIPGELLNVHWRPRIGRGTLHPKAYRNIHIQVWAVANVRRIALSCGVIKGYREADIFLDQTFRRH